jgi:hypothetical protein
MGSNKRKNENGPRYVALYHWVMKTDAWRDLSPVERCAYIEIASRYAGPGSNNGTIPFSVRETADALHIGKTTAMRALSSLQDHGFIVMTSKGGFNVKHRHATEWLLTEFPDDRQGGSPIPGKDFARWEKPKHGSVSGTERYPQRDSTVPTAGQVTKSNRPYGSATGTVKTKHGSVSGTPLVYQGVEPRGGGNAVVETAPSPDEAQERSGRQHTPSDAPAPAQSFKRSDDGPLPISDALAAVLNKQKKARTRSDATAPAPTLHEERLKSIPESAALASMLKSRGK